MWFSVHIYKKKHSQRTTEALSCHVPQKPVRKSEPQWYPIPHTHEWHPQHYKLTNIHEQVSRLNPHTANNLISSAFKHNSRSTKRVETHNHKNRSDRKYNEKSSALSLHQRTRQHHQDTRTTFMAESFKLPIKQNNTLIGIYFKWMAWVIWYSWTLTVGVRVTVGVQSGAA